MVIQHKCKISQFMSSLLGVLGIFCFLLIIASPSWSIISWLIPANYWLSVNDIKIKDTVSNTSPVMQVDRIIHRSFYASWLVELEVKQNSGRFTVLCTASGNNSYQTDAELPDPLTFSWWTWPIICTDYLESGKTYRVETRWTIYTDNYPTKTIVKLSNEFHVN